MQYNRYYNPNQNPRVFSRNERPRYVNEIEEPFRGSPDFSRSQMRPYNRQPYGYGNLSPYSFDPTGRTSATLPLLPTTRAARNRSPRYFYDQPLAPEANYDDYGDYGYGGLSRNQPYYSNPSLGGSPFYDFGPASEENEVREEPQEDNMADLIKYLVHSSVNDNANEDDAAVKDKGDGDDDGGDDGNYDDDSEADDTRGDKPTVPMPLITEDDLYALLDNRLSKMSKPIKDEGDKSSSTGVTGKEAKLNYHKQLPEDTVKSQPLQVSAPQLSQNLPFSPPLNVYQFKDRFLICVSLAGADLKSFDIDYHPTIAELSIKGSLNSAYFNGDDDDDEEKPSILVSELRFGSFQRIVKLPSFPVIKEDGIRGVYKDGLLEVEIPIELNSDAASSKRKTRKILLESIPDEEIEWETRNLESSKK